MANWKRKYNIENISLPLSKTFGFQIPRKESERKSCDAIEYKCIHTTLSTVYETIFCWDNIIRTYSIA